MKVVRLTAVFFYLVTGSWAVYAQLVPVPFIPGITRVTDLTNCGDERLFIVEQPGRIRIADLQGNLYVRPFLDIDAKVNNGGLEQGLLGLAFSPDYKTDRCFYVNYTNNSNNSVIARYRVSSTDPDSADAMSEEILFTVPQPFTNHNGGSMQFGPDGFLYISFGDGGSSGDPFGNAQNKTVALGKILRIDVSGDTGYSVPSDNPFAADTSADQRIWAYGLRNAWRTSFDRLTGDYWIADVGQSLREEVNVELNGTSGGLNYGWRCYEASLPYNQTNCLSASEYTMPVYEYPHGPACSITGGFVYRGVRYGEWFGTYLFADYCSGEIKGLEPDGMGGYVASSFGFFSPFNYTTFGEDAYGEVYLGSFYNGVFRLSGDSCQPVAFISYQDTIFHYGTTYTLSALKGKGYGYQWYLNGELIPGAVSFNYEATLSGNYTVQITSPEGCSKSSPAVMLWLNRKNPAVTVFSAGSENAYYASSQLFNAGMIDVEVFAVSGALVFRSAEAGNASGIIPIGNPQLNNGLYIFRFTAEENTVTAKFMVTEGH